MADVEIPKWLKSLPLAPEFRPTDTEFADPIAYISKIEKEARAFGICKVIPPLPKPSKRYVLNNLNRSLSRCRELGLDVNAAVAGVDLMNAASDGKTIDSEARAIFTTRQQELGQAVKECRDIGCTPQSTAQKQVWQSGEVYTLEQFESKSKAFSRSVLGGIKEVTPQVIEALFWKANSEKPIYVEYANDVPGSGFGEPARLLRYFHGRKRRRKQYAQSHQGRYCCAQQDFNTLRNPGSGAVIEALGQTSCSVLESGKEFADQPTSLLNETFLSTEQSVLHSNSELEGTAGWKLSNSPWNLQVIARSAGSLTRFLVDDIPGVTSPMVYIGMLFSWFAWHVEDHELHSLNFLHMGSPKTWYAVPGDYAFAFEEIIRTQAYGGNIDQFAVLQLIGEKTTLLSPELVIASGIPCCRLVQNPGEFVVTFPRAYHIGFSHGFNCGEAANFGTPQWLAVAKDAAVRRAAMDHLPMLCHQQLLYLLTMSFIPRVPRSLLPGIRSSRLKDRLKEERELLVKRAFIKDVLKENKLLNILSERYIAFRAVLWHPDLLPAFGRNAIPETGTTLDSILDKDDERLVTVKNSNQNGLVHHLTSYAETVNDSCIDDDLSSDFQVDSGALPCVACGILGYPLMSVIQPSLKAAMELLPAEHLTLTGAAQSCQKGKSSHFHNVTKCAISVTNIDETWDVRAFLRPRIFCLEHAVQVEELLRLKGGATMLVICHSDYQKLKVNAVSVAEEIRTKFNYKEVPLDSASKDELSLIDIAIDDQQSTDCQKDWTSMLGVNLRYSIRVRTSCPSKKVVALNPDYLLSVIAPGCMISTIKWGSRKSRSRRKSNHQKHGKLCDNNSEKDVTICESRSSLKRREKVLLQYSRRKHRAKSRDSGAKCTNTCGMGYLPEAADANCGRMDACEQEISSGTFSRAMGLDSAELHISDSTEHHAAQRGEVNMALTNWKCAVNVVQSDLMDSQYRDSMLQVNLPIASKLSREVTMLTGAFTSSSDNFVPLGQTTLGKKALENPGTSGDSNIRGETDSIAEASDLMTRSSLNKLCDEQQNLSISTGADSAFCTTGAGIMGSSVLDEACATLTVHDHATSDVSSNVSEIPHANETHKYGISTGTDSTATREVNLTTFQKENYRDGSKIGTRACSLLVNGKQDIDRTMADAKVASLNRKKQEREVAQAEVYRDFARSPCEGLRPRKRKDLTCKSSSRSSADRKPPSKMMKKSFGGSISCMALTDHKGPYKCNLEGCQMCFRTKAELLLHKRNKCHYEECRKRFSSHKYLVLHQRVHDDKRPLECTWEGCGMTFKWAWARTEHLRLHTGERPYKCKIEGCGRTFRFVSDFSRHRRKTGHYVNTLD